MSCGDVYQRLVTLVNAPDKKLGGPLVELLEQMGTLASQGISLSQFLDDGRQEYLLLLGARGRHHLNLALQFSGGLQTPVAPIGSEPEQQALRDYYHHAYYSSFYIGRYGLVSVRYYDCNQHKDIAAVLSAKSKDVNTQAGIADRLERTRLLIGELSSKRDFADYVMNMARLGQLTNTNEIMDFSRRIAQLYTDWSVP